MAKCYACPRECGVDRDEKRGYCGAGNEILIAKTMVHRFEEPPISGTRGSGAIFFGGCNLGCVYCQNAEISVRAAGKPTTAAELEKIIFDLEAQGVHNIDSIAVMRLLAGRFPTVKLSLMRQYTPEFNRSEYRELNRRVTSFEYKSVVDEAVRLGLDGFTQDASSATAAFTPDFSEN